MAILRPSQQLQASEPYAHLFWRSDSWRNDDRETPPSVSVLDCSHSKGRSSAEMAEDEGIKRGLVCIFSVLEPCRTFSFKFEEGRPFVQSARRKRLFIYFYFMDREFGLVCPGRGAGRRSPDIGDQAYFYSHTT
jgi:hypothetical protein